MTELLEKDQIISLVPQNFKNSNKGKVSMIHDSFFTIEMLHEPKEIEPKKVMEFYSQTKNGMLYFNASIVKTEGNTVVVTIPRKHRFLQRRAFTRIKFDEDMNLTQGDKVYAVKALDISAGGMKIKTKERLDLDSEYDLQLNLINGSSVKCNFEPIKVEKNENNFYTLAGRFINLSRTDKMKLVQFCIRKDIENANK